MPADQGSTYGPQAPYTAENDASQTSQSQHAFANDMPVLTNINGSLIAVQAQTQALMGIAAQAAQDRRMIFADKDVQKPNN